MLHWINHISLYKNNYWKICFPFLLPGSTNVKKMLVHEFIIAISLPFKALHFQSRFAVPIKSIQKKKLRFEETLDEVPKQRGQQYRKIARIFFFIVRRCNKNINNPEIKSYVFLSISFLNLQINFLLSLTLIYTNF